ncbi:uncharacterized protein B0P05DRAFT_637267 [Gilbertella persicaria]|uniref:uncharacterized protein n=1 Tax=Gilbertella persicaria TaxID=101096 RepID=UPI00221E6FB3|nr:uncharacterized protein B0P05DRAFT_637267 [Gilbertella persicaria]KAI8079496.1 hypothetical protein B0P05DRAFT_637267 [Gilbertella persicaria]
MNVLLPKILNTCIVLTSLSFYASRQNTLGSVWMGVLWATVLLAISYDVLSSYSSMVQTVLAFVLLLLATKTGFDMVRQSMDYDDVYDIEQGKKKSSSNIHITLIGLSGLYWYKQGLDIVWEKYTIPLAGLSACFLFSMAFYAAMKHATGWIRQCVYSHVIFFTAAIQASQLVGYLELMYKGDSPVLFSLVYTLRQQADEISSLRQLFQATLGLDRHHPTTAWQNTGYNLYWILLTPLLIYSGYKKGSIKKIK